jgi:hypothetical protein
MNKGKSGTVKHNIGPAAVERRLNNQNQSLKSCMATVLSEAHEQAVTSAISLRWL